MCCRQVIAAFVASQRQTRKNLTRAIRADFERRVLIVGALGIRIRAEISARGRVTVDHRSRDAGTSAIVLETLLECRPQIVEPLHTQTQFQDVSILYLNHVVGTIH
jgi:hypothetical protein